MCVCVECVCVWSVCVCVCVECVCACACGVCVCVFRPFIPSGVGCMCVHPVLSTALVCLYFATSDPRTGCDMNFPGWALLFHSSS